MRKQLMKDSNRQRGVCAYRAPPPGLQRLLDVRRVVNLRNPRTAWSSS